jgi:peroxiredoxin Q/BCP
MPAFANIRRRFMAKTKAGTKSKARTPAKAAAKTAAKTKTKAKAKAKTKAKVKAKAKAKTPSKAKTSSKPKATKGKTFKASPLPEGKVAPAFSLFNQDGKKVSLKDFKGKKNVVLYFYPKAMTPGCTVQACGIRDSKAAFSKLKTVVLGVSPDPWPRLDKFRDKQDLNFDLLSDEDHKIAEKYGIWGLKKFMGREFMGILRTTFIIGKDGKIKHVMEKVNTKTHHDDVADLIKQLKLNK